MKIKVESFALEGPKRSQIVGDLRFVERDSARPVIVFCHGFKGFKDWGCWPYFTEELAKRGFAVLSFNFSHNGIGANVLELTEIDRFKENTFSLEEEDLELVLKAILKRTFSRCDPTQVHLIGHSRGGAAVLAVASRFREIKSVITLASISRTGSVTREQELAWRKDGVRYVVNMRTGQQLPLGVALLDDILARPAWIEESVKKLNIPLHIIHGERDDAVPVAAAQELFSWAKKGSLSIVSEANHVFGAKHPFQETTPQLEQVITECQDFLARKQ